DRQALAGEDAGLGPRHLRAAPGGPPGRRGPRRALRGARPPSVQLRRLPVDPGEGTAATPGLRCRARLNRPHPPPPHPEAPPGSARLQPHGARSPRIRSPFRTPTRATERDRVPNAVTPFPARAAHLSPER